MGAGSPLSSPTAALSAAAAAAAGGGAPHFGPLGGEGGLGLSPNGALAAVNGYALPLDRWTPNTREQRAREVVNT